MVASFLQGAVYRAGGARPVDGRFLGPRMNPLPSVALTHRFLALCQEYGSKRLALSIVAAGRSTGASGLPDGDDWTAWDADEMRAAVDYLEQMCRR